MAQKTDAKVQALLEENIPVLRDLVEAKSKKPAVCSRFEGHANSLLEKKCGAKIHTVQGRFCEQRECAPVNLPTVQPCFSLRWGDGKKDQLETEDFEVLCLTACNSFSNVTFKGLTIVIGWIFGPNGTPALLPDGTSSVFITPSEEICFGDLGPCSRDDPEGRSCVSREVVLKTDGAVPGKYFLVILPCYEVVFHPNEPGLEELVDYFEFELVTS